MYIRILKNGCKLAIIICLLKTIIFTFVSKRKNMKKSILTILIVFLSMSLIAQDYSYQFRLRLKNKGKSHYSVEKPEEFLSKKALDRRKKQNIAIANSDLPISQEYISEVENLGAKIIAKSKWLETITIDCSDSTMVDTFTSLPFVYDAEFVWRGIHRAPKEDNDSISEYPIKEEIIFGNYYGKATDNIKIHKGESLHNAGFKGEGIDIAVIDAGFNHYPLIDMLRNINIKGYKSFVYNKENLFGQGANSHGLMVLSCIGTNRPNQFVGTAPKANFWMLGSEDTRSEYPVEEDYWVAAAEYADSVGVDVINTSLGYNKFDYPAKSREHRDLDGRTAFISRGANTAAQKGMIVVCSAGNSGDSDWRRITSPADAENVLTVGAIQRDSIISSFSSRGPTADLRTKPDVMALGSRSVVVNDNGEVSYSYGTSFSSPIMCGLVACLWQAYPSLTNREILRAMRQSSNRYDDPNDDYGYGIPDMEKAMQIANTIALQKQEKKTQSK